MVTFKAQEHIAREDAVQYGTPRHSGRYPYGSGGNEATQQRNMRLLDHINEMKAKGLSDNDIRIGLGLSTTDWRAQKSIAKNEDRAAKISMAQRLADKGLSNGAIAQRMGLKGESSVRSLLSDGAKDKADQLQTIASMLQSRVDKVGFVDVGLGVETHLGIAKERLATAVAVLKAKGYVVEKVQVDQLGTTKKTTIKVLAPPGTTYRDIAAHTDQIHQLQDFSEDGGRSFLGIKPPLNVDPARIQVKYKEDGGAEADGVIYIRPGVDDISLGSANYAQVRVSVGGTHYMKGMAVYKDDLPKGVDLQFNTNKTSTGNKLDAMKDLKEDPDNPFGAIVRQRVDPVTKKVTSAMNIVGMKDGSGEEGSWDTWSRNASSQFLSKQSATLVKQQLDLTHKTRQDQLDEILKLTNPAVKKKLLEDYAEGVDSAAVHLKAAALPRQSTSVILPVPGMKETEVYAPNFRNGEPVTLIRFPHGGTFEIPQLTVNNNHPEAKKLLGTQAKDAIGISHKVAERLSGADFDGDTVLVIPNGNGRIKTAPALEGLKGFDPQRTYPAYDGMKTIDGGSFNAATGKVDFPPGKSSSGRGKGMQMGLVSNLITDMTIQGAPNSELARAVRHSMVVIDSEKHHLNFRQSAVDNGISDLMRKYQNRAQGGASTLISRRKSTMKVPEEKLRSYKKGGPVDPDTGKLVFEPTGKSYVSKTGKTIIPTTTVGKLARTDDAHSLSSGTPIERIYADHSNKLKTLANEARKEAVNTKSIPYSPSANKVYKEQVQSLDAKLNLAFRNKPLERQAQIFANANFTAKRQANPGMEEAELKKIKSLALNEARNRTGAKKSLIDITPKEWEAIQAGAITNNKLTDILTHADLDVVKKLATPRTTLLMTSTKKQRALSMAAAGYTQADIADALGISLSTLKQGLKEG